MKTGALLLSNDKKADYNYCGKMILRMLIIILVWGLFYNLVSNVIIYGLTLKTFTKSLVAVISADTSYNYQFWYLYMLVGLYLVTPIIKKVLVIAEKREIEYFILISTFICFAIPTASKFIDVSANSVWIVKYYALYSPYLLYYVLGYYLSIYPLARRTFIGAGIVSLAFLLLILFSNINVLNATISEALMMYDSLFAISSAVFMFSVFQRTAHYWGKYPHFCNYIRVTSAAGLGIYILHPAIIVALRKIVGLTMSEGTDWLALPLAVLKFETLQLKYHPQKGARRQTTLR